MVFGYVPSYTSYQDSSGALTIESPLLSYLDVRLPGFLPQAMTSGEARHQGPKIVQEGSPEPIRDGSGDTVFHSQAVHTPIPLNLTTRMVQRHNMALERWFPIAQPIEGQVAPQPISQQANRPLVARQRRKRKRVAKDRIIESGTPPTDQSPTTTTGTTPTP